MATLFEWDNIEMPTQGKSNEWYTPSRYVEAARKVMGGIDLDPASCTEANQTVKAKKYYSIEDDGLCKNWQGTIWLNPPYGKNIYLPNEKRSNIAKWVEKLLKEYQSGNVIQAILLVTLETHAKWFPPLWQYPICFSDHNVRFYLPYGSNKTWRPGRMTDSHMYGTCFVYLGPNEQSFIEHFSQFGRIARAIDTPKPKVVPLSLWEALP